MHSRAAALCLTLLWGIFGCASGGVSPPAPAEPPPESPSAAATTPEPEPGPPNPGPAAVDIRVSRNPIVLTVGETLTLQDLQPTPIDENGQPVLDASIGAAPLGGPATMDVNGRITGVAEGETQLVFAIMPPGGVGTPRMIPVPVLVTGAPVASLRVLPPEQAVYTGTAVPFGAEALTAAGDLRTIVDVDWTSRNPEIASVSAAGFVRGHRPGRATLMASAEGVETAHIVEVLENPVRRVGLSPDNASVRTGDVVRFEASPLDAEGDVVSDIVVTYAVAGSGTRADLGASAYGDGAFVADRPGSYRVVASAGTVSADAVIEVRPREVTQEVLELGVGLVSHAPSSDLWVFRGLDGRDYAYVGTHAGGQKMYAWDVTDPAQPMLTDSIVVDARVVNDVKVNEARTLAVITREGASNRRNGIVVLDLADPAHPEVLSEYTETLTGGVHNTFIAGDLVYAVHGGTMDVHVIDLSDPTAPSEVGRWGIDRPGRSLHDVWIAEGIAYASYWGDGVWILDVGDGRWGGTPTEPAVISSLAYPEGHTHTAFPYTNSEGHDYLFVGDEIFGCEDCISRTTMSGEDVSRGFIHVLSMENPENPVEVGRYEVPEAGAHNIWIEDDRLYVAYYEGGLRVVDVSGELRGDLYRQGREIAWFSTGHPRGNPANTPTAWGPQPYGGNVFVSDMNSGLWVVRLVPPSDENPLFE